MGYLLAAAAVTLLGFAGACYALHLAVRGATGLPLLAASRLWNAVRLLLAIAAALFVLPLFLLFGEERVEEYDPAYDLD